MMMMMMVHQAVEPKSVVVIDKIRMQIEGPFWPFHFSGAQHQQLIMTLSLSPPKWTDLLVNGRVGVGLTTAAVALLTCQSVLPFLRVYLFI